MLLHTLGHGPRLESGLISRISTKQYRRSNGNIRITVLVSNCDKRVRESQTYGQHRCTLLGRVMGAGLIQWDLCSGRCLFSCTSLLFVRTFPLAGPWDCFCVFLDFGALSSTYAISLTRDGNCKSARAGLLFLAFAGRGRRRAFLSFTAGRSLAIGLVEVDASVQ